MKAADLELIKSLFDLIKGEAQVATVFPYVGNGQETPPSNGPALLALARKAGVTPADFKVQILDPSQLLLSHWDYKQQPDKIEAMVDEPERLKKSPPILVHDRGMDKPSEVIDGGHRRTAAIQLGLPIKAVVMSNKANRILEGRLGWKDTQMYRLGNYLLGKGLIP